MKKQRLDKFLMEQGLAKDKREAFIVVTEGRVFVDGQKAVSPAQMISGVQKIEIRGERDFVGRGALKLDAALKKFAIDANGLICADIGAATGGFTEVLLKNGAKKVYAIDTARGKLDLKLREDPRVVVMEGMDVRDLERLSEVAELVTIDISLISLRQILPAAKRFLKNTGSIVALFKPQYETREPAMLRHGIIQGEENRRLLLASFKKWLSENRWEIVGEMESPIRGGKGNVEYLFYLQSKGGHL